MITWAGTFFGPSFTILDQLIQKKLAKTKSFNYIFDMKNFDRVREILLEEFIKAQARNPRYSMRSYSTKIGISQSSISEILSGKRPLTRKTAEKILVGLEMDPKKVLDFVEMPNESSNQQFIKIGMDTFNMLSGWQHFAILSLSELEDFQSDPKWIAARLGVTEVLATQSIDTLLRLKMLVKDPQSHQLQATGNQYEMSAEMATLALKKAHLQNLELARDAIERVPLNERDFSSMTLCFDPRRIDDARKMIKLFRRNFNRIMEAGHKKEVYKLCFQLFPLSKKI